MPNQLAELLESGENSLIIPRPFSRIGRVNAQYGTVKGKFVKPCKYCILHELTAS
jgi:hypothetical protein